MVAELNRLYVARVPGFRCSRERFDAQSGPEMINDPQQEIDLVLLDVPCSRTAGSAADHPRVGRAIDVIMITSAADAATVQPRCITGWSIT